MKKLVLPHSKQSTRKNGKWFVFIGLFSIITTMSTVVFANTPQQTEVANEMAVEYKQLKKRMNVTIQIVDGTGINNQIDSLVKTLEGAGYHRDNIQFDNADASSHSNVVITARVGLEETVIDIKDTLKLIYPEIMDSELNTNPNVDTDPNIDSGFDIVILLT